MEWEMILPYGESSGSRILSIYKFNNLYISSYVSDDIPNYPIVQFDDSGKIIKDNISIETYPLCFTKSKDYYFISGQYMTNDFIFLYILDNDLNIFKKISFKNDNFNFPESIASVNINNNVYVLFNDFNKNEYKILEIDDILSIKRISSLKIYNPISINICNDNILVYSLKNTEIIISVFSKRLNFIKDINTKIKISNADNPTTENIYYKSNNIVINGTTNGISVLTILNIDTSEVVSKIFNNFKKITVLQNYKEANIACLSGDTIFILDSKLNIISYLDIDTSKYLSVYGFIPTDSGDFIIGGNTLPSAEKPSRVFIRKISAKKLLPYLP